MTTPLTVFAASFRLDLARLWLACMKRSLPDPDIRIELFDDSGERRLRPDLLPGAIVLGPAPLRRDYVEAYNDALARVETPVLILADIDVFWISGRIRALLEERLSDPRVAAVSFVSRTAGQRHGMFAVALRVDAYRAALADVPSGFCPAVDASKPDGSPGRWSGHDNGDLLMGAVVARGGLVDILHLEREGLFARFDALSSSLLLRLVGGEGPFLSLAASEDYLCEGCLGNVALAHAYRTIFPADSPFEFHVSHVGLFRALAATGPRALARAAKRLLELRGSARRIETFLRG